MTTASERSPELLKILLRTRFDQLTPSARYLFAHATGIPKGVLRHLDLTGSGKDALESLLHEVSTRSDLKFSYSPDPQIKLEDIRFLHPESPDEQWDEWFMNSVSSRYDCVLRLPIDDPLSVAQSVKLTGTPNNASFALDSGLKNLGLGKKPTALSDRIKMLEHGGGNDLQLLSLICMAHPDDIPDRVRRLGGDRFYRGIETEGPPIESARKLKALFDANGITPDIAQADLIIRQDFPGILPVTIDVPHT